MEQTSNTTPAKNVDEYLRQLPDAMRVTLEKIRRAIKDAAPEGEEVMSYQIPTYKYLGPLVHFAAFKNHCSFFGVSKATLDLFKRELASYKVSGTTIHFSPEHPLPMALVKKFVKRRIEENEELAAKKAEKKKQKTRK
jgi:uncharacterized protein YdhG (YjbR/CyaY superfamily)